MKKRKHIHDSPQMKTAKDPLTGEYIKQFSFILKVILLTNKNTELIIHESTWINPKTLCDMKCQTQKGLYALWSHLNYIIEKAKLYSRKVNGSLICLRLSVWMWGRGRELTAKSHEKTFWVNGNVLYLGYTPASIC